MSQNDFNLANQGFPSMRSDMNSALQALASNSAGATEPSTTYAYQWWYDETTDILKMRNADNDAWISFATFDQATDTFTITTDNIDGLTATATELNKLDGVTNDAASYFTASGALSNRNLIINGAMQVWQRGTSFTPSSVIFGADRFASYKAGASAGDYARSTDVPAGQGFTYSGYFNNADIRHSIELPAAGERGVFVDGSKWTLSFWVKAASSGTATANLGWANGVSASSLTYWGADQSYSYSTSWEKKTITFTVGGSITGSHAAVLLYMSNVAGLYITGVQLEAGDTATPFEHRSYGQELALCQRYYQKSFSQGVTPANGLATGTVVRNLVPFDLSSAYTDGVEFLVEMRASPTITCYNTNAHATAGQYAYYNGAWQAATSTTFANIRTHGFFVNVTGSFTPFSPVPGQYAFTADAEI